MKQHFALVTGASSGIGLEFARQLAQKGYNLLIVSNEEAIHDRAKELREAFSPQIEVIPLVMDLSRQESARELYEYTRAQEIEVEVLVNNAGVYHDRDILDDSEAFTSLILNLHMYTPAMLCYLFGQEMRERKHGYIRAQARLHPQCLLRDEQDRCAASGYLCFDQILPRRLHPFAAYRAEALRRVCDERESWSGRYRAV